MNIKILDSWLRESLKTKASAQKISEVLSLTSVSVEKLEKKGQDYIYDIEVTTNRPDLMSVVGLAREASVVLSQFGTEAKFISPTLLQLKDTIPEKLPIAIDNDPKIVNRIIAVIMEVQLKETPAYIKERLESSGIRSLNNIIDVTNYVMRETGHPAHVFDYDRLTTQKLIIREARKGENIVTLDGKVHILTGGDIIADNGKGEIVDLLGVMGTQNSVVTSKTRKILFFIDNNEPYHIRRTSMSLAIRTEAAVLNEKSIDPELGLTTMLRGIELYQEIADGKLLSNIIDIYPNKPKTNRIALSLEKINSVIGLTVPKETSIDILTKLGFEVKSENNLLSIMVPSWRINDIEIQEDIIEEIARIYGYHKLPNILPPLNNEIIYNLQSDEFNWEKKVKLALKYWGFTEVYTCSMVSEDLLEGSTTDAITISNPLSQDMVFMRKTLIPSLLQVVKENPGHEQIKIFELANVYIPKNEELPDEILTLAGVVKKPTVSFFEVKGVMEQLLYEMGIKNISYKSRENGGSGSSIYIGKDYLGDIEVLDSQTVDFEINFRVLMKYGTLKKTIKPIAKFPPIIEDIRIICSPRIHYENVITLIKKQSPLISEVSLLDIYENKKTYRIKYQDPEKNLTNEEVTDEREKIYNALKKELDAKII